MEHIVKHNDHVVMLFIIEDEEVVSASEHYNEIYHKDRDDKSRLIELVGEVAMSVGGRKGAAAAEEVLRLAPKSAIPLMAIKKYIAESGDDHKEFIESQVLRLTEEITDLRNSLNGREVDWGV